MKAPGFSLRDQNSNTVTLEQFKGKKVVLYFYPKADTPGCTVQACGMRDNIKTLTNLGAVVIGVSPDETTDLKSFEKKYNLNFILLADPTHATLEAYNVWKEKSFMGRRFMGVERTTVLIDEQGNIVKRYEKVNPVTHASMIIEDITGAPKAPQPPAKKTTTPAKTAKKTAKKAAKKTTKKKTSKSTVTKPKRRK